MSLVALEPANSCNCKKSLAAGTVAEYAFSRGVMDVYGIQTPNDMYGAANLREFGTDEGFPVCIWGGTGNTAGRRKGKTGKNIRDLS